MKGNATPADTTIRWKATAANAIPIATDMMDGTAITGKALGGAKRTKQEEKGKHESD